MINPLNNRALNKSVLQRSKIVDQKESESQIYCVICKRKYLIEAYKQHINRHKRANKPNIKLTSKIGERQLRLKARQIEASMILQTEKDQYKPFKTCQNEFYQEKTSICPQRQSGNQSINKDKSNKLQRSISHLLKLNNPSNPKQNPEHYDERSSLIYNLVSQRLIETQPRKIKQFDYSKSPFNTQRKGYFSTKRLEFSQAQDSPSQREKDSHRAKPKNYFARIE